MMEPRDRYGGALLGLATGDALGTSLEFRAPGSFQKIDDMVGGGPFYLAPGEWTDDTSMALCLAESLIETGRFDLIDQLERYTRWADHAHLSSNGTVFDIGNTVRKALANFRTSRSPHSGPSDGYSAGNGSLMRLAAIPLFFSNSPETAIEKSGRELSHNSWIANCNRRVQVYGRSHGWSAERSFKTRIAVRPLLANSRLLG